MLGEQLSKQPVCLLSDSGLPLSGVELALSLHKSLGNLLQRMKKERDQGKQNKKYTNKNTFIENSSAITEKIH